MLDQIHIFLEHNEIDGHSHISPRFGTYTEPVVIESKYDYESGDDSTEEKKLVESEDFKTESEHIVPPQHGSYSFGQQYFYWNYYRNNEWYILQKYNNLKEELICNDYFGIEIPSFNEQYQIATFKQKNDERLQQLAANSEFKDIYYIHPNILISMDHLLAIIVYCHLDDLQKNFSATYRRFPKETDHALKLRHSNYYHFGKLLRETVEVFGKVLVDENMTLYHGIDHPLYFHKMNAKFYGPTSTSKSSAVAKGFAISYLYFMPNMRDIF